MLSCFSTAAMPAMCSVAGRARSQRGQSGGCSLWQVKSQALRRRGEHHASGFSQDPAPKAVRKTHISAGERKGMNGQRIRPNAASCCPSSHCQACLTGLCEGHSGVPPQVAWNTEIFNCHRVQWKRRTPMMMGAPPPGRRCQDARSPQSAIPNYQPRHQSQARIRAEDESKSCARGQARNRAAVKPILGT